MDSDTQRIVDLLEKMNEQMQLNNTASELKIVIEVLEKLDDRLSLTNDRLEKIENLLDELAHGVGVDPSIVDKLDSIVDKLTEIDSSISNISS